MSTDGEPISTLTDEVADEGAAGESLAPMTPLRLLAEDADDLQIISAALQDAIMRPVDIRWEKEARRLTVVLSRFCWECGGTRVMAAMQFGDVQAVKSRRLPRLPAMRCRSARLLPRLRSTQFRWPSRRRIDMPA